MPLPDDHAAAAAARVEDLRAMIDALSLEESVKAVGLSGRMAEAFERIGRHFDQEAAPKACQSASPPDGQKPISVSNSIVGT